ncbi:alpha-internexin-like, partial [Anarrhichthys ocellatus]|uniref:alpha-internexin-like n=1 Tax=Anarrhichthys ocellatus TaxID=433405 RepID=UPI0012EE39C8
GLNDRFAMFIDKVRHLEQQNKMLEMELVTLRQKQGEPSRVAHLYQQELRDLRTQVEELSRDKNRILIERNNMEDELQKLSGKCDEEMRAREEAEQTLRSFRKDVDDATAVRLDLERRLESLMDEIAFLRKVHDEEIQELSCMMEEQHVTVELELAKPDLTSALKEIRSQYESIASKNMQSAEEWYKSKFVSLSEQATRSNEAMRASREEISESRRQLQSKTIEIESLRSANESMERQISEMEDAHGVEATAMQDTIGHLDTELRNLKGEMAEHLREYQDLLNVKMALDIEIAAYRKLLEGEETHFNSGMSFGAAGYGYQPRASANSSRGSQREKDGVMKESFKESSEEKDEADINSNN